MIGLRRKKGRNQAVEDGEFAEAYYLASQWQLMWRKFKSHKLAIFGITLLGFFYLLAIFAEFFAPYDPYRRFANYQYCPPKGIHFFHEGGFSIRPQVYGLISEFNVDRFVDEYTVDRSVRYPVRFFVRGDSYKFWGLFETNVHFFGAPDGQIFLFGTDELGRDLLSQVIYGARISLSIGLVGVAVSFVLGCLFGGISGYFGGAVDTVIQRVIEFLMSIPVIPLWMALAAALPVYWESVQIYFGITVILSIIGWCPIARQVRGKLLELREADFVMAARFCGLASGRIIARHLLPSFMSFLIVSLTLAIPNMILGETSLSFLGLGIKPPAVSWGVLLQTAQNVRTVTMNPWLLLPGLAVILTVLGFNFVGDGLRDAADPYT